MKAIYLPYYGFDPSKDLEKLNQELKDAHSVEYHTEIRTDYLKHPICILLIVGNYTRKDKLKKLKEISERTDNNSI